MFPILVMVQKFYRNLVIPSQVSLEQVAAHYAISSLFDRYAATETIYCYTIEQLDYQKQHIGTMTLAVGQIELTSEITWEHQKIYLCNTAFRRLGFSLLYQTFLKSLEIYWRLKKNFLACLNKPVLLKYIWQ